MADDGLNQIRIMKIKTQIKDHTHKCLKSIGKYGIVGVGHKKIRERK